jgi:hypothetical protein
MLAVFIKEINYSFFKRSLRFSNSAFDIGTPGFGGSIAKFGRIP